MESLVVPEDVKKEIRSILLSKIGGVRLSDFQKDFTRYIGHPLNLKALKLNRLSDLIEFIPDVAVIERSEKDGQNYIRGVRDPNMFMNRTACKAQYKPKPKSLQSTKPTTRKAAMVDVDMSSEHVKRWSEELVPNHKGLYAVGCIKNNMTREDIDKVFSEFGDIVEVGLASKYAFIRYRSKDEVLRALVALHESDIDLIIPMEKNRQDGSKKPDSGSRYNTSPRKTTRTFNSNRNPDSASSPYQGPKIPAKSSESNRNSAGDDLVDMFVGNLPYDVSEDDLLTLFEEFNIVEIRLRGNDLKRFAFVQLPGAESVTLVQKFHKKKHGKFDLVVANANNRTNSDAPQSLPTNGLPKYENTRHKTHGEYRAPPLPDLEGKLPLPDLEGELPLPDLEGELPLPDLEGELPLPDLECELPLPDLESDLPMPGLEYAVSRNDWPGGCHRRPAQCNSNQYSRRQPLKRSDLFVSNFPFGTTVMDLLQHFAPFGAIYVKIKNSMNMERSTSALITFNSEEERDDAFVNAYDTYYNNRPLVVNIAYSSYTPEEEYAMRVQVQPEMPPANDFHENFLVTVPTNAEATSQRYVQKVNAPAEPYQHNSNVSHHAPFHQRAPLLVQTCNYASEPPPLEGDEDNLYHQMAALSMSNGMAPLSEPPPLEQYW